MRSPVSPPRNLRPLPPPRPRPAGRQLRLITRAPAANPAKAAIGSDVPSPTRQADFKLKANFTFYGAGLYEVTLTDFKADVQHQQPYPILRTLQTKDAAGNLLAFYPLAARAVVIDSQIVNLTAVPWSLDPQTDLHLGSYRSATYRLVIVDDQGRPALEIERKFSIEPDSYDLRLRAETPSTAAAAPCAWCGSSTSTEISSLKTLPPCPRLPMIANSKPGITTCNTTRPRKSFTRTTVRFPAPPPSRTLLTRNRRNLIGPCPSCRANSTQGGRLYELEWIASSNRYFSIVAHAPVPGVSGTPAASQPVDIPPLVTQDYQIGTEVHGAPPPTSSDADLRALIFTYSSEAPGPGGRDRPKLGNGAVHRPAGHHSLQ